MLSFRQSIHIMNDSQFNVDFHSFPTRRSSDLGRGFVLGVKMICTRSEYRRIWLGAILWPSFMGAIALCFIVFMLRSDEHTSELQSRGQLVCRLLIDIK